MVHREISVFPRQPQKQYFLADHGGKHLPPFYSCERITGVERQTLMETEEVNMSGRKSPGLVPHMERAGRQNTVVTGFMCTRHSAARGMASVSKRQISRRQITRGEWGISLEEN